MAVNKNFVVKNGIEVSTDLIHATSSTNKVGIGSTIPGYLLDVGGTLGATNVLVSGATTLTQDLQVGTSGSIFYVSDSSNAVGVGTSIPVWPLDVRSSASIGSTALYVYGDATITGDTKITGDLNVTGDIVYDEVTGRNIYISGLSTFVGVSTFKSDVYIDGDLNVTGDIVYDEVTGRGINITGVSTFGTVQIASGIVTATSGVVTYYGDGSNLSGVATEFTSTIGVSSEGTFVGGGATIVNFASSNSTAWDVQTSGGIATATVTPGASIGLVIALGA